MNKSRKTNLIMDEKINSIIADKISTFINFGLAEFDRGIQNMVIRMLIVKLNERLEKLN